jgi:hypothetical protein
MRALLKPLRPWQDELNVALIARTSRHRIKVEFNRGEIRAVDRFRLFAETDRRRRITDAELSALPWQGSGPDPEAASVGALLDHLEERL